MDEWIKKMWCIYTMEYYSTIKGKNFAICNNNMNGSWGYAKWNKSDGEREILYDFTLMWNTKNKQNK